MNENDGIIHDKLPALMDVPRRYALTSWLSARLCYSALLPLDEQI